MGVQGISCYRVGRTVSPDLRVTGSDSPVSDDSSIFRASPRPMSCSTAKKDVKRVTDYQGFGYVQLDDLQGLATSNELRRNRQWDQGSGRLSGRLMVLMLHKQQSWHVNRVNTYVPVPCPAAR